MRTIHAFSPQAVALIGAYAEALAALKAEPDARGWTDLPFFTGGRAALIVAELDRRAAGGEAVLPPAPDTFRALRMTPLEAVRIVILGQDPYPTPGDAHGLAFSYVGGGRLPASLKNIHKEIAADLGGPAPVAGDLSAWARQGVLLLNTALSVAAGAAGAHARLGWDALADEVVRAVSCRNDHVVFILWGAKALARRGLVDEDRHLVIASAHPSPLSARTGFFGSKPFSRANEWFAAHGLPVIDWTVS